VLVDSTVQERVVRDLRFIAVSTEFHDLRLSDLSTNELDQLYGLIADLWSQVPLDTDDALSIRFEWLMPMIDVELRHRSQEPERL
jgi:hypothetical protein